MKLIGTLIFAFIFIQCASINSNSNLPFSVKKANYSSISNNLIIEFTSDKPVDFQKIYYQNKIINAVVTQKLNAKYIIANSEISTGKITENFILNSNSKKEYGNKIPVIKEDFPFQLKENQAIISYKIKDKIHFYKIENIKN